VPQSIKIEAWDMDARAANQRQRVWAALGLELHCFRKALFSLALEVRATYLIKRKEEGSSLL